MESENKNHLVKIILVGPSGAGKSAFLTRAVDDDFTTHYKSTIGVDFKISTYNENGSQVKLQIWDTAGQERFQTITSSYYRGSNVIIFFYDLTFNDSYEQLKAFHDNVKGSISPNSKLFVLGMKSDLEENRGVTRFVMEGFAKEINAVFLGEVSAANNPKDELMEVLKTVANNSLQQ